MTVSHGVEGQLMNDEFDDRLSWQWIISKMDHMVSMQFLAYGFL